MRNANTSLILLEIAQGLSELSKNPDLSAQIKASYALSAEEEKKYKDAQILIAQTEKVRAEIEAEKEAVKKAAAVYAENGIKAQQLEEREAVVIGEFKKAEQLRKKIEAESENISKIYAELDKRKAALDAFENSLNERKAGLDEYENALKEAAAKSQAALSSIGL